MKRLFYLMLLPGLLSALGLVPAGAEVAQRYDLRAVSSGQVASNVAIVALNHKGAIYLGTSHGLSYSDDGGQTWMLANAASGLRHDDVSALYSDGSTLWLGANRDTVIGGELYAWSEGLYYSYDDGNSWNQINFGPGGLNISNVWGGDRTVYDITGLADFDFFNNLEVPQATDWMFFASFAGGLLASQDGGTSWRRLFPSAADSIQYFSGGDPSLRNRVFSCVADTSHGDSVFVWVGTAGGLFQYAFVPPREKFYQQGITQIAFCDTCTDTTGAGALFLGGPKGTSAGRIAGGPYYSRFRRDLNSSEYITALISVGGTLFAGAMDPTVSSTHLLTSTDNGKTFSPVTIPGLGQTPQEVRSDFNLMNGRLYLAAQGAGLFVSADTGLNWTPLPLDTFTAADVNTVYSLGSFADTLFVGTDAGMLDLFLNAAGAVDSSRLEPFAESDTSSSRVIRIGVQMFPDTAGGYDSAITWTVNEPVTVGGTPMVGRRALDGSWAYFQKGTRNWDIGFLGSAVIVVGELGARFSDDGSDPIYYHAIQQKDAFGNVVDEFINDTIRVLETHGDTLIFGCDNGYAISIDGAASYGIRRPNVDTLRADFVTNHTFLSSLNFDTETYGITGDFIPALGIKYNDTGTARIWVSGRPVDGGFTGRSYGEFTKPVINEVIIVDSITLVPDTLVYDTIGYGVRWEAVDTLNFAWNFANWGDTVFSAGNNGLMMDTGGYALDGTVNIPLVNDTIAGDLVDPGTAVYAAAVVDPYLWLGTDDGTLRFNIHTLNDGSLFARVDSLTPKDEVYAFPVPFRPKRGEKLDFHFVVDKAGYVTLEVYDFAMNLVARPIDNVYYEAGVYPNGIVQGRNWDGRNGRGDIVAVGIFYFKVILGSGEPRWGKLAVIP